MKNVKKWVLGLIPIVIFLLAFAPTGVINDDNSTEIYNYYSDDLSLKSSGYYSLSSAIVIDDTVPANNWETTAAAYDW